MFILRKQPRCIIRAQDLLLRHLNDLSLLSYPMRRAMEMSIRFLVHFSIMVCSLTILPSDNRLEHHYFHENVVKKKNVNDVNSVRLAVCSSDCSASNGCKNKRIIFFYVFTYIHSSFFPTVVYSQIRFVISGFATVDNENITWEGRRRKAYSTGNSPSHQQTNCQ